MQSTTVKNENAIAWNIIFHDSVTFSLDYVFFRAITLKLERGGDFELNEHKNGCD